MPFFLPWLRTFPEELSQRRGVFALHCNHAVTSVTIGTAGCISTTHVHVNEVVCTHRVVLPLDVRLRVRV